MQGVQVNKPTVLNLDKAKVSLQGDEMFYSLNNDVLNTSAVGKNTPLPANYLLDAFESMPAGDNYVLGSYYSQLTNETYVVVGNTNNAHFVYRINGDGTVEIVNNGECLKTVLGTVLEGVFAPMHSLDLQCRMKLHVEKICHNRHGKRLVWTNGLGEIACIDVEASIVTNSFTTPFFNNCEVGCEVVQLCVPEPCGCITATFIPLAAADIGLTNKIVDQGFKFMIKGNYYDLRETEWILRSAPYYQSSKSCFSNTDGFPRCMELIIPLLNPLVDKIDIAVSTDNGVTWSKYDTVEKYESYTSSKQYWYERQMNAALELTEDGCSFKYTFCNDKQCQAIAPDETARVYNPMPRQPQGFIDIKNVEGYFNFIQGNCPIDRVEIDKFTVTPICTDNGECSPEYVDVKVRALVHNFFDNTNTPIFRHKGTYNIPVDDVSDTAFFGLKFQGDQLGDLGYHSHFFGKMRNFTAYIEGTNYFVEMKQWKASPGFVGLNEYGIVNGFKNLTLAERDSVLFGHDEYFFQECTFRVKKGTKGFIRIKSHESESNTRNTSTFIKGTINNIANYRINSNVQALSFNPYKNEIYFDATAGDVGLMESFVIENPVKASSLLRHSSALFFGYLKLQDLRQVEYAELFSNAGDKWMQTDHNGFFFRTFDDLNNIQPFSVRVEQSCVGAFTQIKSVTLGGGYGGGTQTDITLLNSETTGYRDEFLANVTVPVVDCSGVGVGGVVVALSGSKSRITNANGIAHFEVRNVSARNRVLQAIAMDNSGCLISNCAGDCNTPLPSQSRATPACYGITSGDVNINFYNMEVNIDQLLLSSNGLKKGGSYEYAILAEGDCGRISAAYPLKNGLINIPKLQENGIRNFCSFEYNAGLINLPKWVSCLKILRTENLSPYELQWIVDKIEKTADGKIKLTIQSLNDYNSSFLFKTNTVYQYLKGDRIEFIRNGNGLVFNVATYGLLNYNTLSPFNDSKETSADYFNQLLIEDDNRLDGLLKGAVIEFQRVKECTTEPTYFEICANLQVLDGQVMSQTGSFETFDTYLVSRTIGEFYQQIFEHHAPSDFWGDRMSDIGKAYFSNKYENERRYGRSIILNAADAINRFDSTLIKTFDAPGQGDITALRVIDSRIIQAVCQFDYFSAQIANDLARVGSDGLLRASRPDQIITDIEPKLAGEFGCDYPYIGSIFFGNGYFKFEDVDNSAFVVNGKDVSVEKFKSYLKRRHTEIRRANSDAGANYLEHFRFATGVNTHDKSLYTTIKKLSQGGINNARSPYELTNTTLRYHPDTDSLLTFVSFTPESYSELKMQNATGCSFICFQKALPYITPIIFTECNTFFGESCSWVIGIAINQEQRKIKRGISLEVQDAKAKWFASKVETDTSTFNSEIPVARTKRNEDKINLPFLSDKNSRGGLFNGNGTRGYFIGVTLVRDESVDLKYATVSPIKQKLYSELNLILSKFVISESSGYPQINQ